MHTSVALFAFLSIASIALFSFVAVIVWSDARRREREAYYRTDTIKKIAESHGGSASAVEFLREEEKASTRRRLEGYKLGGLITVSVGIGLMIFIKAVDRNSLEPSYLVGLLPLLIGVALLVYAYLLAPKL